jgi:uncharacterized membrane protein
MPYTVNGIGTHVCGSRGNVGFNSYDAMEWLVVLYMPIIPIKAYHTFDWNGQEFRMLPIKWSFDLVFRTFMTGWNWGFFMVGCLLAFIAGIMLAKNEEGGPVLAFVSVLFFAIALIVFIVLRYTGERDRNIRRVLGPDANVGSVDPAVLEGNLVKKIAGDPQEIYGKSSHTVAAAQLLHSGEYARAMWAARIATAVEDRQQGEEMTTAILSDPGVREALKAVKADPSSGPNTCYRPRADARWR